ncbi:Nif3-like dinuclear metal center hexameric protein [Halalkalibacter urbisdiaboli]|uniref:Nif3-like dinuclear metal center hexameric protein n=1 Tax=Halalkalibacter urbisdiaboli TaxID=1960589 RepID=UPI000B452E03|nr:Nif3-like dinuclear metal center hexameric protein [Halalkalibacter urbisdiaboli]
MGKTLNAQTLIQHFETWSPKAYAVEGDKNGLMIGTLNKPIKKVMIALDVLEEVMDEAIREKVDLILAHHPLLFRPLKKIDVHTAHGRIVEKAIKHNITIYAAHTNLDVAIGGVNDMMAHALGLTDLEVLAPTQSISLKKLVVFVPESHETQVREALGQAGAGHIGAYRDCAFTSNGVGVFRPEDEASPFIGEAGKLEYVEEKKIETIIPAHLQGRIIAALMKAHPYEEPAYDIYPLDNRGEVLGLGRVGYLKEEMSLAAFAEHVKQTFDVKGARVVGNLATIVRKVGVLGGDGNKYMSQAIFKGVDVFVTGDVYYHVAHDAMMEGLNIVDPGHNVEKVMKVGVQQYLQNFVNEKGYDTEIMISTIHTDPFQFV